MTSDQEGIGRCRTAPLEVVEYIAENPPRQWLRRSLHLLGLLGRALIGYVLLFLLSGVLRLFSGDVAFSAHQLVGLLIPIAVILGGWLVHLHAVWRRSER